MGLCGWFQEFAYLRTAHWINQLSATYICNMRELAIAALSHAMARSVQSGLEILNLPW